MSKKVDTWMPLLVDKYLGDTTHLTTEQHGAYLLLLMTMWKRDGKLPTADTQLATIARLSLQKWRAMKPVLMEFFRVDGDSMTQKRLSAELVRSKANTEAKAGAGSKGAEKRWRKDGTANGTANGRSDSRSDGTANGRNDGRSDGTANGRADDRKDGEGDGRPIASGWQTPSQTDASTSTSTVSTPKEERLGYFNGRPPARERDPSADETGGQEPTAYGLVARQLRQLGISRVQSGHPGFRALIDAGASIEEFQAFASKAMDADDPFTYLVRTLTNERKRAAAGTQTMHRGAMPSGQQSALEAHNAAVVQHILESDKESR